MNAVTEQRWIAEARKHIGLVETKGSKHSPEIVQMWRDIKRGGIKDDETPWCAAFVGAMLERVGYRSSRFEGAASYLEWGIRLVEPIYGCIVVFSRNGGAHVGFVVGRNAKGDILVLGGNQNDAVNIKAFTTDPATTRIQAYRYPVEAAIHREQLPLLTDCAGSYSTKES